MGITFNLFNFLLAWSKESRAVTDLLLLATLWQLHCCNKECRLMCTEFLISYFCVVASPFPVANHKIVVSNGHSSCKFWSCEEAAVVAWCTRSVSARILILFSDWVSAMMWPICIKYGFCVNAIRKFSVSTITFIHWSHCFSLCQLTHTKMIQIGYSRCDIEISELG